MATKRSWARIVYRSSTGSVSVEITQFASDGEVPLFDDTDVEQWAQSHKPAGTDLDRIEYDPGYTTVYS